MNTLLFIQEVNVKIERENCFMNLIYCFSGTGNSMRVANELASVIGSSKVISASDQIDKNLPAKAETIGFVFPVYSLGIPSIMEKLIKSIDLGDAKYIYAIATMGGSYGISFDQIEKILKSKGKKLSGSFSFSFGGNSNLFMKIPGTTPILSNEELDKRFLDMKRRISLIAQKINSGISVKETRTKGFFRALSTVSSKGFKMGLGRFDKGFHVENCTKCGLCAKSCPVNNIQLSCSGPVWKGKCEGCLRCFNICPENALLFGKMEDPKMYERYTKSLNYVREKSY